MKLFRNPEIQKSLLLFGVLSLTATVGAFLWRVAFGFYVLALCAIFLTIYLLVMQKR